MILALGVSLAGTLLPSVADADKWDINISGIVDLDEQPAEVLFVQLTTPASPWLRSVSPSLEIAVAFHDVHEVADVGDSFAIG